MRGNFRGEVLRKNYLFLDFSIFLAIVIFLVISAGQISNGDDFFTYSIYENYSTIHHHSHPIPLLAENIFGGELAQRVSLFPDSNSSNASIPSFPPALPSVETIQGPCVFYDLPSRTINVCGGFVSLDTINRILRDPSLLNNTTDNIWFLNANISVLDGATLTIGSNNTKWLKINSSFPTDAY
jgi:hypothetical protein